jgi:hypothetical protein
LATRLTVEQQSRLLYWPTILKIPVIEANTVNKKIFVNGWQQMDFSNVDFKAKLLNGDYDNGAAIRCGLNLTKEYYVIALDFDGWNAIEAWFGTWDRVLALAKKQIVEWHQDRNKIHVILLSKMSIPNRKMHIKDAFLEIRCEKQALFVSPSIHQEGSPYSPIEEIEEPPEPLANEDTLRLKSKIEYLCENYMSDTDKEAYERWLDEPTTVLGENQGRHDATKFKIIRNYWKYENSWFDYTDEQRFNDAWRWHLQHCKPPRTRDEFDRLCEWTKNNHRVKRDIFFENIRDQKRGHKDDDNNNAIDPEIAALRWLPKETADWLKEHVYIITCYSPKNVSNST